MTKREGIKVFAPATIGNIAVGFDILGMAIDGPGDQIKFRTGINEGLKIAGIHGDNGKLPRAVKSNTAGFAAYRVLEEYGLTHECIEMEIYKKMPFGSGMGSSAASAVAGAFGMNLFLGEEMTKKQILKFAVEGEQIADGAFHADNVAPSLFGGISLIRNNKELDVVQIPVPIGLIAVLIYPHVRVLTKDSRGVLSDKVDFNKYILQSGNLAAFVCSLYRSDFDLMKRSLEDIIVEPQRKHLIPNFDEIKSIVNKTDALGFSISGAGPSMFALCNNSVVAESIRDQVSELYKGNKEKVEIFISPINKNGAYKC